MRLITDVCSLGNLPSLFVEKGAKSGPLTIQVV
jgi:hypothetical protein